MGRKSQVAWFGDCLIKSPVRMALCMSKKAFMGEMRQLKVPKHQRPDWLGPGADATTHILERQGKRVAIVCLGPNKERDKEQVYALLAHEAMHVWQEIRVALGERRPSDEFEAYAVQGLVQDLLYAYTDWSKEK